MRLNIGGLIGAIIIITVGILMLPIVQDQVTGLVTGPNATLTGVAATLMEQVPLFYVLGLVFIALAWAIGASKAM